LTSSSPTSPDLADSPSPDLAPSASRGSPTSALSSPLPEPSAPFAGASPAPDPSLASPDTSSCKSERARIASWPACELTNVRDSRGIANCESWRARSPFSTCLPSKCASTGSSPFSLAVVVLVAVLPRPPDVPRRCQAAAQSRRRPGRVGRVDRAVRHPPPSRRRPGSEREGRGVISASRGRKREERPIRTAARRRDEGGGEDDRDDGCACASGRRRARRGEAAPSWAMYGERWSGGNLENWAI